MRTRKRQAFLIAGIVLFAAFGAFVWTEADAARTGERLTYEGSEAPEPSDKESGGETGSLVAKNDDGTGSPVVTDGGPGGGGTEEGGAPEPSDGPKPDGTKPDVSTDDGTGGTTANGGEPGPAGNGNETDTPGGGGGGSGTPSDNTQTVSGGGNGGSSQTGGGTSPAGPDPFAGDPGGDPADGSRPSDGVPAVPYDPALETAAGDGAGEPDVLTAAVDLPALFSPVDTDDAQGVPADGLIEYLRETDPAVLRDESAAGLATLAYADGNVFEVKTLADGKTLVTMTYRFPTGQKSRRGDMTYDEKTEKPRAFAAFEYLLPEYAETAENDFASMRHWEEVYCRAYGLAEADWSAFVRSRYYGARYCRMSVTRDTVTVTLYPAGYVDDSGDFAANGSYREFFTYPIR